MVNQLPFQPQIRMRPAGQPEVAAPVVMPVEPAVDLTKIRLLDLDLIRDQWHHMTVAEKAAAIAAKLSIGPQEQIMLITRLDAANPLPRVIEYRERTVCIPVQDDDTAVTAPRSNLTPAGQAATPSGMSFLATATMFLIVGGLLYTTINIDGRKGAK